MSKIISLNQAITMTKDSVTLMVGGFLGTGAPERIIDALVAKNVQNLTLIANDTAFPDRGIGKLVAAKQAARVIVSHIGTNSETGRQMAEGSLAVELVPQGTLAERIRSGGSGLGGVLTPTGIGTFAAEGKEILHVDGKEYLLEKPLKADIALIKATMADMAGNLIFRRTTRNFNPLMATAAKIVIAEVDTIVPAGAIDPDDVMLPGIFVDFMVPSCDQEVCQHG